MPFCCGRTAFVVCCNFRALFGSFAKDSDLRVRGRGVPDKSGGCACTYMHTCLDV